MKLFNGILDFVKHLSSAVMKRATSHAAVTYIAHNTVLIAVVGVLILGGGAVGIASVINHNDKSPATQTQPNDHGGNIKTDSDAPNILVKDPKTGETRAVSLNDIKKNPTLLHNVIETPTATDYQNAGVDPPKNPAIYDCVKVVTDGQTYYNVLPAGSGVMITDPIYCITISDSQTNNTPSQPEVRYSTTTYTFTSHTPAIEKNIVGTLSDGSGGRLCTGTGTRVGFNTSTTYYIGGSDIPTIPSRQYNMDCKRYEYVSNGNGAYTNSQGSTSHGFFTFYALYQFTPVTFTYQMRKISCTIHTHQTNIFNNNTQQYFDRDYDTTRKITDTYPTSSIGYSGQDSCSFIRNDGVVANYQSGFEVTYDANNHWMAGGGILGFSYKNN